MSQVSEKKSELGIGQLAIISHRYDKVDYLPFMYNVPFIMGSGIPKPIVTFDSIVYPFDLQVWGFTFACIITQFLLLQLMQYMWNKIRASPYLVNHIP